MRCDSRGGSPGAAGDPPREAPPAGPADRPLVARAAQVAPASFAAMPEVDRVLGNAEKMTATAYRRPERVMVGDIAAVGAAGGLVAGSDARTRGFLMVQNGCDHRCTFCTIPFGRGPSRSVPMADVSAGRGALAEAGHAEIVLTGVDLTSYGGDLPGAADARRLVRAILFALPDLPRLRLSSLDAAELDPVLHAAIAAEERLMPAPPRRPVRRRPHPEADEAARTAGGMPSP